MLLLNASRATSGHPGIVHGSMHGIGSTWRGNMAHIAGLSMCCWTMSCITSGVHCSGASPGLPSACSHNVIGCRRLHAPVSPPVHTSYCMFVSRRSQVSLHRCRSAVACLGLPRTRPAWSRCHGRTGRPRTCRGSSPGCQTPHLAQRASSVCAALHSQAHTSPHCSPSTM